MLSGKFPMVAVYLLKNANSFRALEAIEHDDFAEITFIFTNSEEGGILAIA